MCLECISEGVVEVPDLEPAVPSDRNEVGVDALVDGGEPNHAYPIGVVALLGGEFAIAQGVEQLQLAFGTR